MNTLPAHEYTHAVVFKAANCATVQVSYTALNQSSTAAIGIIFILLL